jgi:hypothetical protein
MQASEGSGHLQRLSDHEQSQGLFVLRAALGIGIELMEALLVIYLGNPEGQPHTYRYRTPQPASHLPSHVRLACVSYVYHNRNAAHSQQIHRDTIDRSSYLFRTFSWSRLADVFSAVFVQLKYTSLRIAAVTRPIHNT